MNEQSAEQAGTFLPSIAPCGDCALAVEFAQSIETKVNARVRALDEALTLEPLKGVLETMPAYGSLLVQYDPQLTSFAILSVEIRNRASSCGTAKVRQTGWCIPVVYGGQFGFDLEAVSRELNLDPDEIVHRHAASRYHVFMIGFLPGFTYLGGLDQTISTPRRPVPRPRIPAGSIVIGGKQTAVASIEGPSGWHVIGRTPVHAFMADRDPSSS